MRIIMFSGLVCMLAACSSRQTGSTHSGNMDTQFDTLKGRFVESLWQTYPGWASGVGYHKYDSILVVPDNAARQKELDFCHTWLDSLKGFDATQLSDNNHTDMLLMQNQLESSIWGINEEKAYEWNPSVYNVAGSFAGLLNDNYDTLDTRLRHFSQRLVNVPAYYDAAKQNINHPTLEHTQLAVDQNTGGLSVFVTDLPAAIVRSHLTDAEKTELNERRTKAISAVKDYVNWLKTSKNDSPRSFRLGAKLYADKFKYDIQSHYTIDEIYNKAVEHKKELHQKMTELANQLWPKYMGTAAKPTDNLEMIKQVIDKISLKHVDPSSLRQAIEHQLPELKAFIQQKNLLHPDFAKPLVIREEPAYMGGVAPVSISSPGPYDKDGNTYYNVANLGGMDKEKAESYLREYNIYLLQILNIHEAIPGHYVQQNYANKTPSMIKAILGSTSMIEGWAVYTERMMLENGYGNNEPEMWLMYYKWNLRSTCNTILDYNVHVKNMTKDEVLQFLVHEGFQQQAEAEGKWRRVNLSQVQLTAYFTGYSEIYELREEIKKQQGDKFDLAAFHEKFLSYGSIPVKYIRDLMLKEK